MCYMGAYPGVGASPGYYGSCTTSTSMHCVRNNKYTLLSSNLLSIIYIIIAKPCTHMYNNVHVHVSTYLAPHPNAHGLWSHIWPNPKPLRLSHQLVQQERLSGVEFPHNSHHCHSCLDVMEVPHILIHHLQLEVALGVGSNQLDRFVW